HGAGGHGGVMTLRTKLLLAQAPPALAIVLLGAVAGSSISGLATKTDLVLRDNFRSVLAAQRMKESVERLDSATAAWVLGRHAEALQMIADNQTRFETELQGEEGNITQPGEEDAARRLGPRGGAQLGKPRAVRRG